MASGRAKIPVAAKLALARAILVAGTSVAALLCNQADAQAPAVTVVVVKATNQTFDSAIRFTGLVVPRAEAIVNLNAEGYEISEVVAEEGDMVSSGQTLAKLTRLTSSAPAGPAGAPGSQGAAAAAQMPATMTLTAPVGGLVSKSTAKVGAVAAAIPLPPPMGPEPLFQIIVGNKLEIEANVPSFQLPKLKPGDVARVRLENGREISSKVRIVLPEIDRTTQLGKVRLTVDSNPAIRAGMFASGTIAANHSYGVSIPRSAVQYQGENATGTTVQVVNGTTVETRHVRLGLFSDTDIEVLDGVKEGELVIANAGTSLHDGEQVKISDTGAQ
jgi:multidrug efflux pump subunit AcrA (membrane-fusion protein)